jgi:hypothetical protein
MDQAGCNTEQIRCVRSELSPKWVPWVKVYIINILGKDRNGLGDD